MRLSTSLPVNLAGPRCCPAQWRSRAISPILRVRFVTLLPGMLSLLLLCFVGCASKGGGAAPAGKATPRATIVPDHAAVGKVVRVNPVARFAILSFPVAVMPALDQHLFVYRGPAKVGELKVSGPRREESIVADILNGDCQPGDEVRDR